ncbi:MAG: bifunctional YncE family protein/alkaline phosphatase family protein, partial [Calditrichaeota bacterium]|nr:bifunctional YncE family protein/alkaline phosphatase family protein [Calditrichota bacterium]
MKYYRFTAVMLILVVILFSLIRVCNAQTNSARQVGPQPDGSILVPTNQLLRPAGFQILLPGRPVDIALSPDERWLAVLNRKSLDLIRVNDRVIMQTLPFGRSGASFHGICFSPDGKTIYVSEARDRILVALMDRSHILHWDKPIKLPRPKIGGDPVPGGFVLDEKNNLLFVTLSRNNSLALLNLADGSGKEIPVGVAPYDVLLYSQSKAYVSDWGGRQPGKGESTYNTSGSKILVDPQTGVANNGAISVVDLKTGTQVKSIEVGLHPSAMALSPDKTLLYVACANSDIISVIDTKSDQSVGQISVHPQGNIPFGSAPNALAVTADGKYLYVANGTDNAICVIQLDENKVLGYIPTGWYPGAVKLNKKGNLLFVANIKGIGSRNQRTDRPGYNSHDYLGTISIIPVPSKKDLEKATKIVHENNSFPKMIANLSKKSGKKEKVPVPQWPGQVSYFKHVVYIIKENRTYDQLFGDMPQGNGDSSLVQFGRNVTPNHHTLAETFVLMDNYYCSGILSADGHQWTDEAYVTDYLEKSFGDFTRSYPYDGDDALAYAKSGFIWDNVLRHGLTFRDYGEFVTAVINPKNATYSDIYNDYLHNTTKVKFHAKANLEQLEPYLCKKYVGFPNSIPDVYRAKIFIDELKKFEKNNNFPNFIIMLLPNDHTSGTRPGRPTPQAAVADNDLALGRIVEAISHSKFWKETCIFVTEDDPQNGLDHVDGHRTVGLVISPYTKRGQVISTNYSQINMVRTIENILGIPPMNQFDLTAEPMLDYFTDTPDFSPYKALPNQIPLDQLNPPLESLSGKPLYWAKKSM